jgi:NADPH:quinone reductase
MSRLAELPASVTFAQAATLPIAGLTALHALEKGGFLLNKRVLITGSTGGVGLFTHQLARLSGAYVVGTARQARHEALVREAGADEVIVGDDISPARAYGPYHLIIESLVGKHWRVHSLCWHQGEPASRWAGRHRHRAPPPLMSEI